ncbi:P-II family nitrogen regulator [Salinisphaera aquimarina]|uniref:P-II family nitrogen regulator n=1 Tax=Salinisphaera aquimarina TaxID=2094031 RepID=A0ABV7EU49_9GAMM
MKEIKAYTRAHMLDQVIDALVTIPGMPGIAVVYLRAYGHATDAGGLVRIDMAKLQIDVSDALAKRVVKAVVAHARTGNGYPGDGRISVYGLDRAVRIADGNHDPDMRGTMSPDDIRQWTSLGLICAPS